jgi:hypothetical protein
MGTGSDLKDVGLKPGKSSSPRLAICYIHPGRLGPELLKSVGVGSQSLIYIILHPKALLNYHKFTYIYNKLTNSNI